MSLSSNSWLSASMSEKKVTSNTPVWSVNWTKANLLPRCEIRTCLADTEPARLTRGFRLRLSIIAARSFAVITFSLSSRPA